MITPGRPVKDIVIDSNTSIEKIFEELSQSGGFESVNTIRRVRNFIKNRFQMSNVLNLSHL